MISSPAIDLQDVTVAYHRHLALHGATLQLPAGTICGVVGMNGAGKSTLFKAIMGFVKPIRGQVRIHGLPRQQVQRQSLVAYVPQSEDVDWQFPLRVWDVVMMGRYGKMNWLRQPTARDRQRVRESLEQVELWPCGTAKLANSPADKRSECSLPAPLPKKHRCCSWMNPLRVWM